MSTMSRKGFLKLLGGLVAGSAVVACHSSTPMVTVDAGPDAPAGCGTTNATVTIATNHVHAPHAMVVTKEEVAAGVDKTYDIMGAASHTHTVLVTAANFATLKGGGSVMITSSTEPTLMHNHVVTVSCA
ncbi:MAG: hypothetical protein JWO36_1255 [Myxococcales bacterium]|nr:hypothetical protein [Myxococcales bacterium]